MVIEPLELGPVEFDVEILDNLKELVLLGYLVGSGVHLLIDLSLELFELFLRVDAATKCLESYSGQLVGKDLFKYFIINGGLPDDA